MSEFSVHVKNRDLASFRRRVLYRYRQKPNHEYLEVIFIRHGKADFHIESFHKIRLKKTSPYGVDYDDLQYQAFKNEARSRGLGCGIIHTHTTSDSAPSLYDMTSCVAEGDPLVGVMEVEKTSTGSRRLKTKLDFWVPQLPCRINQI